MAMKKSILDLYKMKENGEKAVWIWFWLEIQWEWLFNEIERDIKF